jgi:hypothetical protein
MNIGTGFQMNSAIQEIKRQGALENTAPLKWINLWPLFLFYSVCKTM